jgi:DnaJ domain
MPTNGLFPLPPSSAFPTVLTLHSSALQSHPDRVPAGHPERSARTKKFQLVNDAYYTLSDPTRRRDYDSVRAFHTSSSNANQEQQSSSSSSWSSFGFTSTENPETEDAHHTNAQFGSVFEEMLREEGMAEGAESRPTSKFWSVIGGLSGGALGFIVANFPGMLAGAVAGNRLGAVRDTKGKSVYAVFQELPQEDKARLLSQLAAKVLSHAVGVS